MTETPEDALNRARFIRDDAQRQMNLAETRKLIAEKDLLEARAALLNTKAKWNRILRAGLISAAFAILIAGAFVLASR